MHSPAFLGYHYQEDCPIPPVAWPEFKALLVDRHNAPARKKAEERHPAERQRAAVHDNPCQPHFPRTKPGRIHCGRAIWQMVGVLAELERSLIQEWTQAGREAAKWCGVKMGCKPKLSPQQVTRAKAH